MTPEEHQLLTALTQRIKSAPAHDKDQEADQLLQQLQHEQPDATYLLAQTVLMQDFALRNAQAQIADLQRQMAQPHDPPQRSGGFLSGLFGGGSQAPQAGSVPPVNPWARSAPPPQYPAPQAYPQQAPMGYAPQGYGPVVMQPSQTSGFLRSAATTAAGIAGGALLFEGIQGLFSGHQGMGGGFMNQAGWGGGGWGDGGMRESISETTINNYYDGNQTPDTQSADYAQSDPGFDQGYQNVSDSSDYSGSDSSGDFGGGSDDYV